MRPVPALLSDPEQKALDEIKKAQPCALLTKGGYVTLEKGDVQKGDKKFEPFGAIAKSSQYISKRELTQSQAEGLWAKYSDEDHPHTACFEDFEGDMGDGAHAFCAKVEEMAAGTTPAERATKK